LNQSRAVTGTAFVFVILIAKFDVTLQMGAGKLIRSVNEINNKK